MTDNPATDDDQTSDEPVDGDKNVDDAPETFPREYVAQLRSEAAEARVKAKRADLLADRLLDLTLRTTLNGVLADPADLLDLTDPATLLDDDGLPNAAAIRAAADSLVAAKPHLAVRPRGDIDQGSQGHPVAHVDLAGTLRRMAG